MDVGVVIPLYNDEECVAEAVSSVLNQTVKPFDADERQVLTGKVFQVLQATLNRWKHKTLSGG